MDAYIYIFLSIIGGCLLIFGGILSAIWREVRVVRRQNNRIILSDLSQEKDILSIQKDIAELKVELKVGYKELDKRIRKIENK